MERLREFMRDKIALEGITNMVVLDGTIEAIPFEDNTFDIVMSAHVVGLDYVNEIANLERVVKNGGCNAGFEYSHYISKSGGDVYRYWNKVYK